MGAVESALSSLSADSFTKSLRAHKLHLAFRAWSDVEVWSAFRRVRKLYPNATTLTLAQTAEVLGTIDDSRLLFLWDFASDDDLSVDLRFLLSTVCLFSGCPLNEKGRFLLCLFDRSFRGVITFHELTSIAFTIVLILEKCFPSSLPLSSKDVVLSLRLHALPKLFPSLAELISDDESFHKEQVVGASDVNLLLNAIRDSYNPLPFADSKFAIRNQRSSRNQPPNLLPQSNIPTPNQNLLIQKPHPSAPNSRTQTPTAPVLPTPSLLPAVLLPPPPSSLFNRDIELSQLRAELNRANALIKALQQQTQQLPETVAVETQVEHNSHCCTIHTHLCPNHPQQPTTEQTPYRPPTV